RVAEEVGRRQQFGHGRRHVAFGVVAGQLVASELFPDEAVIRLVGVEGANDVIAVLVGEGPVAVGVEVAVGVRVPGCVEPVFSPALAVVGRGQVAFDQALIGIGG